MRINLLRDAVSAPSLTTPTYGVTEAVEADEPQDERIDTLAASDPNAE